MSVCLLTKDRLKKQTKNIEVINLKLYLQVVYENTSDEFDIEHCVIKIKVMGRL